MCTLASCRWCKARTDAEVIREREDAICQIEHLAAEMRSGALACVPLHACRDCSWQAHRIMQGIAQGREPRHEESGGNSEQPAAH